MPDNVTWGSVLAGHATDVAPTPESPWAALLAQKTAPTRTVASGVGESALAGFQGSATGLAVRGKLPDIVLDQQHAAWYEKLSAGAAQTIAELPEMMGGFLVGSAIGGPVVGGGAGTFGVPTLIRESLIQAYESGEAQSSSDFLTRAGIVVKQTAKDALVGALTFGAGKVAQTAAKTFGPVAAETANLTAQTGTMVVAPAALEGRLPEPVDFMNAAIMVAGGKAATAAAGRIRNIYAKTGVEPLQVVADAAKDPTIKADLTDPALDIMARLRRPRYERVGTGEFVEVPAPEPTIMDLAKQMQPKVRDTSRAEVFMDPHAPGIRQDLMHKALAVDEHTGALTPDMSMAERALAFGVPFSADPLQEPHYSRKTGEIVVPDLPDSQYRKQYHGVSRDTVFLHELAHALTFRWEKSGRLRGSIGNELRAELRAASEKFRPTHYAWSKTEPRTARHLSKNTELTADGLAYWMQHPSTRDSMPLMTKFMRSWIDNVARVERDHPSIVSTEPIEGPLGAQFEKPGFLRSGEEMLAGRITLKSAEDMISQEPRPSIRERKRFIPRGGQSSLETSAFAAQLKAELEAEGLLVTKHIPAEQVLGWWDRVKRVFNGGIPRAYQPLAADQTARDAVPGTKAKTVLESPFAGIPDQSQGPAPTDVHYKYINSSEDAKAAMQRLSQVYEADIQAQRRGTVEWSRTIADAEALLKQTAGGKDARLMLARKPGTPAGDAELLARKQLMVGAAEDMARTARDYDAQLAVGTVTPNDTLNFLASIERASVIQSEFLGARAETGRALNALKITQDAASRAKVVQEVLDQYGQDPAKLAAMLKAIDTPEGALKFAKGVTHATTWEKLVEVWKAGLVSGPITQLANIAGNTTFTALRVPVNVVAAGVHTLRHGPDAARLAEPLGTVFGILHGTADGLRMAGKTLVASEYEPSKIDARRPAIEGLKGEVIRTPFRLLATADSFFRTINERATAYELAFPQAITEGLNPVTREFRERVVAILEHPTLEQQTQIEHQGQRFTFNLPLGEKGRAVEKFVHTWHLEWAVPFLRFPGNSLKEFLRLNPATAPFVQEWRDAVRAGGIEGEKARAELVVGGALMAVATSNALNGWISGAGDPDPNKRRIDLAAGWQPYSVKIGDTWYDYTRWSQPVGTLFGLAADMAEVWEHTTPEERDRIPKMLGVAFANAITHPTALQGFSMVINSISDFERYGVNAVHNLTGSVVPSAVAQLAQARDPLMREVDDSLDAVKARVPIWRETLRAKRDPFGEPIPAQDRTVGYLLPAKSHDVSTDKVRVEASRLRVGVAKTPESVSLPAAHDRTLGRVALTPDQQDMFADVAGHLAYAVLHPIVNGPTWGELPDMVQKRIYEAAFEKARKRGAIEALPPEQRMQEIQRITDELVRRLAP